MTRLKTQALRLAASAAGLFVLLALLIDQIPGDSEQTFIYQGKTPLQSLIHRAAIKLGLLHRAKQYTVVVTMPDKTEVEWEERSMRKAEQGAAEQALLLLRKRFPDLSGPES